MTEYNPAPITDAERRALHDAGYAAYQAGESTAPWLSAAVREALEARGNPPPEESLPYVREICDAFTTGAQTAADAACTHLTNPEPTPEPVTELVIPAAPVVAFPVGWDTSPCDTPECDQAATFAVAWGPMDNPGNAETCPYCTAIIHFLDGPIFEPFIEPVTEGITIDGLDAAGWIARAAARRGVWHIRPVTERPDGPFGPYISGRDVTAREVEVRQALSEGFRLADPPDDGTDSGSDGRVHPTGQPCPACTFAHITAAEPQAKI